MRSKLSSKSQKELNFRGKLLLSFFKSEIQIKLQIVKKNALFEREINCKFF